MKDFDKKLAEFRSRIDALDDKLIALLDERSGIVEQVGRLKAQQKEIKCILRPGREATMVRRMAEATQGRLSRAAIATLWRTIIAGSCNIEENMRISAYCPESNDANYWLAREYFGVFSTFTKQPQMGRVISDVIDGHASVGVLPTPQDSPEPWWAHLIESRDTRPQVFARIPLLEPKAKTQAPDALAIALVEPEPTGDDTTLLVIHLAENVSRARLTTVFGTSGLKASLLTPIDSVQAQETPILIAEVQGFVTKQSPELKRFETGMGAQLISATIIGAYANPLKY